MSATSEALSGRAAQLLTSIAFFRIRGRGSGANLDKKALASKSAPGKQKDPPQICGRPKKSPERRHGNCSAMTALKTSTPISRDIDLDQTRPAIKSREPELETRLQAADHRYIRL